MTATARPLEGMRRRDAAFTLLEARRAALVRGARRAFLGRLLERGEATIDDVRDVVPLPDGIDPKTFGPIAKALAKLGIIEAAGFAKSRRFEAHARPITVWRLKDRAAGLRWLEANPLIAEPLAVVSPPMTEGATALTAAPSTQRSLW